MEVHIGPEIIRSYRRLSYTTWHALAEFIDNSLQSYVNNQERLENTSAESEHTMTVKIDYKQSNGGKLTVWDNAMGMAQHELSDALRIGRPPADTSGLSEFGMGLKTAACWFGNQWTVCTKKLDETEGHIIKFDVEQIASGDYNLHYESFPAATDEHYTEVSISDLNQGIYGRAYGRIRNFLGSMYRVTTNDGTLKLLFNDRQLRWVSPVDAGNIHISSGEKSLKSFEFDVNGKKVDGWIAILERGSRSDAGFAIIRRGRVIKGWPDSWRPQTIYGQYEGSNDLVNQRLVGEINLNSFSVSHTKDDIVWQSDEREILELKLADIAQSYVEIARSYRRRGARGTFPSNYVVTSAMGMLEEELQSPRFRSVIATNGNIPKELYQSVADPMINAMHTIEPRGVYSVDGVDLQVFLSDNLSDRDPYLGIEIESDETLNVVINMQHPYVRDLRGQMGVLNHLKACTYEGVAQWKVRKTWDDQNPSLIRAIKDSLLRIGSSIDDEALN